MRDFLYHTMHVKKLTTDVLNSIDLKQCRSLVILLLVTLFSTSNALGSCKPEKRETAVALASSCDFATGMATCEIRVAIDKQEYDFLECLVGKDFGVGFPTRVYEISGVPMINAVLFDDLRAMRILNEAKFDLELKDKTFGMTALMAANFVAPYKEKSRGDRFEAVKFLLESGADPNTFNDKGLTPLMIRAGIGHHKFVSLLLKHGAKVDLKNKDGETALMLSGDDTATVKLLLDAGASLALRDKRGRTATFHAISKCQSNKLRQLKENGAAIPTTDDKGISSHSSMKFTVKKCAETMEVLDS